MKVWKLSFGNLGGFCAFKNVEALLYDLECMEIDDEAIIECVEMTEEEYESLGEFQGF